MKKLKTHTDQQLSDLMQEVADSFRSLRLYTAAALCQETAMRLRSKKRLAKPRR